MRTFLIVSLVIILHLDFIFSLSRLHHTQLPTYLKEMKKYHLAHHYKNFDLGFGVTSA